MPSIVLDQLDRFGPTHCQTLSRDEACAYTMALATGHYENFSVISRLVPRDLRPHFASVYAFCRWADDLGDETGDPAKSTELLTWWRDELDQCYAGEPRHPVFVALQPTIHQFSIPAKPFEDLIDAFEQDQRVGRYQTWDQVIDYCRRSANPVGRLVLYLSGYREEARQELSDATCTALQLVNFWQDVRRDIIERDRIYVPADALTQHSLSHEDLIAHVKGEREIDARPVIRELVDRTWPLFETGRKLWPMIEGPTRSSVKLFTHGGEHIMKRIEQIDYRTLDRRPTLTKFSKALLVLKALAGRVVGR
jgi:squalene synthase HpnC